LNPSKFNTELWENPVTWWAEIPFTNKVNKFLLKPGTNNLHIILDVEMLVKAYIWGVGR
jgi:hypothetical protein